MNSINYKLTISKIKIKNRLKRKLHDSNAFDNDLIDEKFELI